MLLLFRLLLLLVAATGFLAAAVISSVPKVGPSPAPSPMDSVHGHQLVWALFDALESPGKVHHISLPQSQMDALERLANHGLGWVRPRLEVQDHGAVADVTVDLGRGGYLNLSAHVAEHPQGFPPIKLKFGTLSIPSGVTRWVLNRTVRALDLPAPEARLDRLISSFRIEDVKVEPAKDAKPATSKPESAKPETEKPTTEKPVTEKKAVISVQADPELFEGLKSLAPRFGSSSVDPQLVRFYYSRLLDNDLRGGIAAKSFSTVVSTTFRTVVQRSEKGDPAAETRAALLAISLLTLGEDGRTLASMTLPYDAPCIPQSSLLILAGRPDLPKHLIMSSALAIVFADRFSKAAGEWKELHDSVAEGGTGFSFVDLMADRAGLRLGMAANGDLQLLREMQYGLAYAGDERLLPVWALQKYQEGLRKGAFEKDYAGLEDERYRQIVADIDAELDKIPLYKVTPKPSLS